MFLLNGFLQIPWVKVVAGCDVYGIKHERFERCINFYSEKGKNIGRGGNLFSFVAKKF
jgi:hypothetical protein